MEAVDPAPWERLHKGSTMDWAYKAVLTATVVGAVMMAARLFGRPLAGLLAGLPVIAAPTLLWLAHDEGVAFASGSALGSLATCAAAPLFACAFVRLAGRRGAVGALLGGSVAFAAAMLLLQPIQDQPWATLLLAGLSVMAVHRLLARCKHTGGWVRPLRGEPWISAVLAGVIVAAVTLAAQSLGPFWSGVAATLPIVSACALEHLRRAGSEGDLVGFAIGYANGSFIKALVLFIFWVLVSTVGAPLALALGLLGGSAVAWLMLGRRQRPAGA